MTTAKTKRMLRDLVLEGKIQDKSKKPAEKPKEPPKSKLHLNIGKLISIIKRIKKKVSPTKKGTKQKIVPIPEGETKPAYDFKAIWGIAKFIIGYGIIGGFVLFLALMLFPFNFPLAGLIKGSVIAQIIISIIGTGSLIYLAYDWNLLAHELRDRGK